MTEKAFALNVEAVNRLDFVDQVTIPGNVPFVFVELSPRLVSMLPAEYHTFHFLRENLTVDNVLTRYERYVEKLKRHGHEEALEVAQEMLRMAKCRANKR